jgi:hypothetical protein
MGDYKLLNHNALLDSVSERVVLLYDAFLDRLNRGARVVYKKFFGVDLVRKQSQPKVEEVFSEKLLVESEDEKELLPDLEKKEDTIFSAGKQIPEVKEIVERREIFVPADLAAVRSGILLDVEKANSIIRGQFEKALDDIRITLSRTTSTAQSSIQMVTLSQKIDSLSGTSLANISVSGVSGLTDSDIPDAITVTGTQSLTSVTASSLSTFSGGILVNNSTSTVTNLSSLHSTTTNATSTFLSVSSIASTSALTVSNNSTLRTLSGSGLFTLTGGLISNSSSSTITNLLSTYSTSTYATSTNLSISSHASTSLLTVSNGLGVGVSTSTTGNFEITGSALFGDSINDVFNLNSGILSFANRATTSILSSAINAYSIATSTSVVPFLTFDTSNYRLGIGTTSPSQTLSLGGAGHLYALGGIGVGIATTTSGALETTGAGLIGGAFNVTGVSSFNASTTLIRAGVTGDSFLGDASTDFLTVTASSTFQSNVGFNGSLALGDAQADSVTFNSGLLNFPNVSTSTIISSSVNAFNYATTSANIPFLKFDTSNYRLGIGTTSPSQTLSLGGAGHLYALGGIGVGIATTTSGVLETTGAGLIGGAFNVTGVSSFNASTTLIRAGVTGDFWIGDAQTDRLTINAGVTNFTNSSTSTIPSTTLNAFSIATSTTVTPFLTFDTSNYRLGIGTTSPSQTFSVGGAGHGYFLGGLGVGTATTTQGNLVTSGIINITGAGTSTFTNGIKLTAGCILGADNNCVGGTPSGTDGQIQYNNSSQFGGAGNFVYDDTNTRVGIGTSTPGTLFSLASLSSTNATMLLSGINMVYASSSTTTIPTTGINVFSIATSTSAIPMLTFDSTNSRVGIGTTSPGLVFSIAGNTLLGSADASLLNIRAGTWSLSSIATTTVAMVNGINFDSNTLVVDPNANRVGIGMNNPTRRLHVSAASASDGYGLFSGSDSSDVARWSVMNPGIDNTAVFGTVAANDLAFITNNATSAIIKSGGLVGIATTSPVSTLSVQGSLCVRDTGSCGTGAGEIYTTGGNVVSIDVAENYPTLDESIEAGDVVSLSLQTLSYISPASSTTKETIGTLVKAEAGNGLTTLGVISTKPGLLFGYDIKDVPVRPVALSGRVPVKVSTESGPIKIGDRITSSSLPGTGMKATKDGVTVGIALEPFDGANSTTTSIIGSSSTGSEDKIVKTGKILVFVNLGYSRLDSEIATAANGDLAMTNAWSIDQSSGKVNVNFFGDLNLNGNSIFNVSKIIGMDGKWKIDEDGTLTAVRVITDELIAKNVKTETLCIGATCITEEELKTLLQKSEILNSKSETNSKV